MTSPSPQQTISRIEGWTLLAAVAFALTMGFANLGVPSLWHDELVHVYVGKSIAETGMPALPSGVPYFNGTTFNLVLAAAIEVGGVTETAVRTPAVLIFAASVGVIFLVLRPLVGRWAALLAAVFLATSPWAVAWGREARFYGLQLLLYLVFIGCAFKALEHTVPRWKWYAAGALLVFGLAILTSFHSILFVAGPGLYVGYLVVTDKTERKRWLVVGIAIAVVGALAFGSFFLLMNSLDREAVFDRGGLGGTMLDPARSDRGYYFSWLRGNLSTGFFGVALLGFCAMAVREGRRGVYTALAFWGPLLVLTFLIGYRQPRFMYFAYPFFIAGYSYGIVAALDWWRARPAGALKFAVAAALLVVGGRLAWSQAHLMGDVWETASGAHTTLARRHPQWKKPCAYVKEHVGDGVILTTTFIPVYHYVGRVDNWFPTEYLWWEQDETGYRDLHTLDDLARYVEEHPKGYYLAERYRFDRHEVAGGAFLIDTYLWVERHMERVDEAWTTDVRVYRWGYGESDAVDPSQDRSL